MSDEGQNNSESLPKVEQDGEGGNRTIDESRTLLRSGQVTTQHNRTIRYFSMFTGIGGFELALERANALSTTTRDESRGDEEDSRSIESELLATQQFTCVGMSEWDKYSSQVLKYKFPNIKNWGDCTKIKPEELPDFDMLCGGFPCQAFSIAGKRRGFEDTRGTMFFEVARILKVKRPKIVLLENVKGLLNHAKGETFRVILQTLDELGYEVQWMVLNSKFFGVPQNRERVLIIGNLRGTSQSEILPLGTIITEANGNIAQLNNPTHSNNRIYGKDGISPSLNTAQGGNRQPKIQAIGKVSKGMSGQVYSTDGISPTIKGLGGGLGAKTGLYKTRAVLTPNRAEKRQNGRRFKEDGEPSFTLTGQDIHGVMLRDGRDNGSCLRSGRTTEVGVEGYSIRRLTPRECCRLQGFPDDWNEYGTNEKGEVIKMSDAQRYKQMGNAVTTNVIAAVGMRLLNG